MKYLDNYNIFNESLETPAPIKWNVGSNKIKGIFNVEGEIYVIVAKRYKEYQGLNVWNFKFYWKDDIDVISSLTHMNKGKFKILSTVIEGFKFMMSRFPDGITFTADIKEDSRIKFYNVLCEKAKKQYGLKLDKFIFETKKGNIMAYCLYSDDRNKEFIIKTYKELIPKFVEKF